MYFSILFYFLRFPIICRMSPNFCHFQFFFDNFLQDVFRIIFKLLLANSNFGSMCICFWHFPSCMGIKSFLLSCLVICLLHAVQTTKMFYRISQINEASVIFLMQLRVISSIQQKTDSFGFGNMHCISSSPLLLGHSDLGLSHKYLSFLSLFSTKVIQNCLLLYFRGF